MIRLSFLTLSLLLTIALGLHAQATAAEQGLTLEKGDHISLIGNVLAERIQHHGWLETLIQSQFPEHELVFRNLAYAGDEVATRSRSMNYGSPDEHLTRNRADVVFAMFGHNESFAGQAGLEKFKQELGEFIKHTLAQKYNGTGAPRLVLFSPVAHENLHDRNLPDGSENNQRLRLYTRAMSEVARAGGVLFVDLFIASQKLYETSEQPLTINGIHLTEYGNRLLAEEILRALFSDPSPDSSSVEQDEQALEKIRAAVLAKNVTWFHRYHTTDGYNVYGERSLLEFIDDISNRDVFEREMEVLDAMTANRDRRIWAVARGSNLELDDSNTPAFIPVTTNSPGPLPGGKYAFLSGDEAIGKMTPAPGMKVHLFATEEMFPEMVNPVQMAFDTQGRLWVAAWPSYPHWKPKDKMDDKLLILEDTDGDGRADLCKTFAGGLHDPTGFEFWGGGVLVAQAPNIVFLKDIDGDDVADIREPVLHGFDSADTHHTANSFTLDPGGALYFQEGLFHRSQIETIYHGSMRNNDACVWRFEPRTWKVDRYVPYNFQNPHGHVYDRWGQGFIHDGTDSPPYHATIISGHLDHPKKHSDAPQLYEQRTRPGSSSEILSSAHFPEANQGNLLVANVIGFLGILQYKIEEHDSSFHGVEVEPIVSSTDPNFRPADIEVGPDGAIYFTDWHNPLIGHMQHHLRDPSRDQSHGRVYRITYEGRPLLAPPKIAGASIEKLLDLLKDDGDRVRYRTRIELSARDTDEVIAAAEKWADGLDPEDPDYEHHMLEALWVHQQHNVVNERLLKRMLRSPDHRARAAATRVLCYWRDRVKDPLALLKVQVGDEHPNVRLEAVRACSFIRDPAAMEIALEALKHPMDRYLEYTLNATLHQFEK